ncbi:MAG: hypothetical protein CMC15_16770 [Flavobacteriaceae bacterium]|nr:hypothetical protein [Flavobacteriaceae bacterium]
MFSLRPGRNATQKVTEKKDKTRVVLHVPNDLRRTVVDLAKEQGKVLSAFYLECFKKGLEVCQKNLD